MGEPFDAFDFARYAHSRWRMPALTCGTAILLAAIISLASPKRYTATASVLISPPAGNDPRAATALSPVYLESLKTFEKVASSDSLFFDALTHLRVPEAKSGRSIESLKSEILHVSKPANTNVLEIQATLRDPRAAQALAQDVAERTVALRGQLDDKSQDDVTAEAGRTLAAARTRMERAQATLNAFIASDPIEALEDEASNTAELIFRLRRDLSSERAGVAEYEARRQQPGAGADPRWIESEISAARARVRQLDAQDRELTRAAEAKAKILEDRKNRREVLESELHAARVEYEAANTKLNDIRASAMFRGERLQVIDPGIVPRKPSSPNLLLNLIGALLIALVLSVLYLAAQFSSARARLLREDRTYVAR